MLTVFLLLSNLGASIAEVANDAIVAEAGKQQQSKSSSGGGQQLQSFAWMFGASAGALGNLLGGIAISSRLSPKTMFLLFALILILQFFTTVSVPESSLNLPNNNTARSPEKSKSSSSATASSGTGGMHKQMSDLSLALSRPDIFRLIIWFSASYAVIPLLLGTMFFYQTQELKLGSSVIGLSKVFGQAALLAWSVAYDKYFKRWSPRRVISALQFTAAVLMLSDMLFVQGVYRDIIGMSDSVYVVVFSGLLEALLLFKVLPFSVLVAQLCPAGCEGSLMAFVMSALALASIVAGYFGVALASLLGVSADNFSKLPLCVLIEAGCTLLPLYWSSWISDGTKPDKKDD